MPSRLQEEESVTEVCARQRWAGGYTLQGEQPVLLTSAFQSNLLRAWAQTALPIDASFYSWEN